MRSNMILLLCHPVMKFMLCKFGQKIKDYLFNLILFIQFFSVYYKLIFSIKK